MLDPLDASGNAITDPAVINGQQNHSDFEWAWYQHSIILTPSGTIMVFDNGDNRNYTATGFSGIGNYSRAVEFRINENDKTIQQLWSYGKNRGDETYSRIVSKVNYYGDDDHILFTPGAVVYGGKNYGKVIELDYATQNVIFEATIYPPQPVFNITFHNVHRVEPY
ncbi:MAG: aryl-sulfate sulfotransferase [Saprospiraceae bacterium]|nr:aryl-sulfate sulfotransferase [Saprospiraceae bacterium]